VGKVLVERRAALEEVVSLQLLDNELHFRMFQHHVESHPVRQAKSGRYACLRNFGVSAKTRSVYLTIFRPLIALSNV